MKIVEVYVYGNGCYAKPFWTRVQEKIDEVEKEYTIIDVDKKYIPARYLGKNCMGMDRYKVDEIFLTLYCEEKYEKM